jgi:hypothetical protein
VALAHKQCAKAAAFVLHHVRIGKDAITKLTPVANYAMNFFFTSECCSIERGAMNAPRFWKLREEHLAEVGPPSALHNYQLMN